LATKRVAVDAQEARAQALLPVVQGAVHHVAVGGGAHREVLELGLQIEHLGHRHAQHAAAVVDGQHVLLGLLLVLLQGGARL
jgi:hypothetical protein